ncbi:hypothetical protein A2442_04045 [Candidatus Campbellbacteria bacterium RIFOXYC2_FULL_35_25]|uniref:Cell division protein FtsX n=1 Tax=Candidatus Campbellbacteria bacterium RIFOXYC2_FULL_35_25 TaxID=1797582 RepID=A0A1F5EKH4_9BACT|nr:MAG: hypothetical protein A2442_04045 [Candidatus Campbellbacteria bacterium RIFOXYC2_FULL_35_25]
MFITNTKRIIKAALVNFWRNKTVSMSAVLVVSITLLVFGSLIFSNAALDSVLLQLKDKVDINVYFTVDAGEEDILELKKSLESFPEVESVEYVSREMALENFRKNHENDQTTLEALDELGDNPLGATLNVQANETDQYESIAKFLGENSSSSSIIDKVNYYQNKLVIDRLTKIISNTERVGFVVTLILIIISIIITFNTIRLAIYIAKEEISVMMLVGASNRYVRGPFVIEGVLYGIISSALALIIFLPVTFYLGSFTEKLLGVNVFEYYLTNFFHILLILLVSGVFLGVFSSYLAVRKYLKV